MPGTDLRSSCRRAWRGIASRSADCRRARRYSCSIPIRSSSSTRPRALVQAGIQYHARDAAAMRARRDPCYPVIMTAIESQYMVESGHASQLAGTKAGAFRPRSAPSIHADPPVWRWLVSKHSRAEANLGGRTVTHSTAALCTADPLPAPGHRLAPKLHSLDGGAPVTVH